MFILLHAFEFCFCCGDLRFSLVFLLRNVLTVCLDVLFLIYPGIPWTFSTCGCLYLFGKVLGYYSVVAIPLLFFI